MRIEAATEATQELLEALTALLPQLNPKLKPLTMERLSSVISDPATTLLVVSDGVGIVGAAAVLVYATPAFVKARIEDVVVDEHSRGQGVGEALVRRCIEVARDACRVLVHVEIAVEVGVKLRPRRARAIAVGAANVDLLAVDLAHQVGHQSVEVARGDRAASLDTFVDLQLQPGERRHDEEIAIEVGHRFRYDRDQELRN